MSKKVIEPNEELALALVVAMKEDGDGTEFVFKNAVDQRFKNALVHHFSDDEFETMRNEVEDLFESFFADIAHRRNRIMEAKSNG